MRLPLVALALFALGCGGSAPTAPDAVTPEPAPAATPTPVAPTPTPAPAPSSTAPRVDGPSYSDAFLVILASNTEADEDPPALATIAADPILAAGTTLGRLDSSRFKGLMPCYDVVFAYAGSDRGEAFALSKLLTDKGVDNYVKRAGKWVGARPAVEAHCARQRAGDVGSCGGGLRFAESWGGATFVALDLDESVSERALASQGARVSAGGDDTAWVAPLTAQTVGDLSVGAAMNVGGPDGGSTACAVKRFVALTRGTPHWGWFDGPRSAPGCGGEEVFAELDCGVEGVLASADALPLRGGPSGEYAPADGDLGQLVRASSAYGPAATEAKANAGDVAVDEVVTARPWTLGDRALLEIDLWLKTNEGYDDCGGEDVNINVRGLVDAKTKAVVVPFQRASYAEWIGVLDADGDDRLEVLSHSFPGVTTLHESTGDPRCSIDVPYCDCPC